MECFFLYFCGYIIYYGYLCKKSKMKNIFLMRPSHIDHKTSVRYADIFLLCCSYLMQLKDNDNYQSVPQIYNNWKEKNLSKKQYWIRYYEYLNKNVPSEIIEEISKLATGRINIHHCGNEEEVEKATYPYSREYIEKYSKEELVELLLSQQEEINNLKNQITSILFKKSDESISQDSPIPSPNFMPSESDSDERIQLRVRDRTGEKAEPYQSNIDLREDDWIKGEDKEDGENASIDPTRFRHTMIDILRVIYTLWKLGYFVEFNPDVMGKKDFDLQKKAKLKDVIEAFGNVLNIPYLYKVYDNQFAKSFSVNEDLYRTVNDEDILRVFDRMKNVMKGEIDNRRDKRNKKSNHDE